MGTSQKIFRFYFVILCMGMLGSCAQSENQTTPPTQDACASGSGAHILVTDGAMTRLCGCQEPNDTTFQSGENLTCTLAKGRSIIFVFTNINQRHQIKIGSIFSTPIILPQQGIDSHQTYGFELNEVGTFQFSDLLIPELTGTLNVTP